MRPNFNRFLCGSGLGRGERRGGNKMTLEQMQYYKQQKGYSGRLNIISNRKKRLVFRLLRRRMYSSTVTNGR